MKPPRVAVVGGGIAGLAAAHRLLTRSEESGRRLGVMLFERDGRLGGKIRTDRVDVPGLGAFLVEAGPDSFLARKREALDLVDALGLLEEMIPTRGAGHGSYVYLGGRPRRLPEGLVLMVPSRVSAILATDVLTLRGKARALLDLVIPRGRPQGDESLASFITRRLGREVLERIAEPLIAGIHGAEPETMSLRASFPRMLEMEAAHGSLIRAALAAREAPPAPAAWKGRPLSYFMSLKGGMEALPRALSARLGALDLRTGEEVLGIDGGRGAPFRLRTDRQEVEADAVVLAVPAEAAARLLGDRFPSLAEKLGGLRAVGAATASFAFRQKDVGLPLRGHGFVIPRTEGLAIMGVTYSSLKWEGRSPSDEVVLLRAFLGGPAGQAVIRQGGDAASEVALRGLRGLLKVSGEPLFGRAYLFPSGMPQYTLGHVERIRDIEAAGGEEPRLRLAGAAYHGIGIPDCIGSGVRAADGVLESILG